MFTVGAVRSTMNVALAGEASVPPLLDARTWKVCEPSASDAVVYGDVHAANAAASTLHSNVAPVDGVAVNAKVGVSSVVGLVGADVIVVSGALPQPESV